MTSSLSYMILAPALMKKKEEDNDATRVCLEHIELDADKYRMGHTKVASTQAPTFAASSAGDAAYCWFPLESVWLSCGVPPRNNGCPLYVQTLWLPRRCETCLRQRQSDPCLFPLPQLPQSVCLHMMFTLDILIPKPPNRLFL